MTDRELHAGVYLRVSDDKWKSMRRRGLADDRGSIIGQEREGRDAVDDLSATLVGVYADPDKGASRYSAARGDVRVDWERLRQDVRDKVINLVVLWESSRGDRQLTPWSSFVDDCRDTGTLVHIMEDEQTYDPRKPRDWKALAMQGVENESEADVIARRRRRTVKRMQSSGQPDGRVTYGYKSVYDPETGKLIGRVRDDAGSADQMVDLFSRYANGESIHGVRQYMEHTYPGRPWTRTGVRGMLLNPRYIGMMPVDGQLIEATWEGIIPLDVWKKVQARMRTSKQTGARSGSARHLLSYLATCSVCGDVLVRQREWYICNVRKCSAMRAAWLDEYITKLITVWWSRPATRAALRREQAAGNSAITELEARITVLEARRETISTDLVDPDIPAEITRDALKHIGVQLRVAREQMRRLEAPAELQPLLAGDSLAEVEAEWERMTEQGLVGAQREIVRATLEHVTLIPRGRTWRGGFDPRFVDAPYRQFGG